MRLIGIGSRPAGTATRMWCARPYPRAIWRSHPVGHADGEHASAASGTGDLGGDASARAAYQSDLSRHRGAHRHRCARGSPRPCQRRAVTRRQRRKRRQHHDADRQHRTQARPSMRCRRSCQTRKQNHRTPSCPLTMDISGYANLCAGVPIARAGHHSNRVAVASW